MLPIRNELKIKKLKGKTTIDFLFKRGAVYQTKNLLLRLVLDTETSVLNFGVSVSKRNFNRAVDRNRIKRQLRAVLKHHEQSFSIGGKYMLLYTGKNMPEFATLIDETKLIINNIRV